VNFHSFLSYENNVKFSILPSMADNEISELGKTQRSPLFQMHCIQPELEQMAIKSSP